MNASRFSVLLAFGLARVTRTSGTVDRCEVPVDVWLAGARSHVLRVPRVASIARVEIDPEHWFPDVVLENNVWTR